jgi:hypothetical protein
MWILTKSRFNANWKSSKYYWIYIITTKFIIGLKNEKQDCRKMCYVTFVSVLPVLIEESRGPKHNWPILPKALHPSSFHCCQPQDPSHVFVLPSLLALCARLGARPLVFVCPRKLLERESYLSRGNKTHLRSLSFLSFTHTCISHSHSLLLRKGNMSLLKTLRIPKRGTAHRC